MQNRLMGLVEATAVKKDVAPFEIGDTVDVHQRILEGQKERVQVFSGVVISRRGDGMREMFTVRRIVQGEGVERQFPLNSPRIAKIEVKRTGVVRRAKLYYLRDRVGKATRLRERKPKVGANGAAKTSEGRRRRRRKPAAVIYEGAAGGANLPRENPGGGAGSAIAPNAPPRVFCAGSVAASWRATTLPSRRTRSDRGTGRLSSSSSRSARPAATTPNGRPCRWTPPSKAG